MYYTNTQVKNKWLKYITWVNVLLAIFLTFLTYFSLLYSIKILKKLAYSHKRHLQLPQKVQIMCLVKDKNTHLTALMLPADIHSFSTDCSSVFTCLFHLIQLICGQFYFFKRRTTTAANRQWNLLHGQFVTSSVAGGSVRRVLLQVITPPTCDRYHWIIEQNRTEFIHIY